MIFIAISQSLYRKKIVKYETLMRIVDGDVIHAPFHFLDISKKVKLYESLQKDVLKQAFLQARKHNVRLSVNLSIEDILNNTFSMLTLI